MDINFIRIWSQSFRILIARKVSKKQAYFFNTLTILISPLMCMRYAQEQNAGMRVKMVMHITTRKNTKGLGVHFGNVSYGVSVTFFSSFHIFRLGFSRYTGDKFLERT